MSVEISVSWRDGCAVFALDGECDIVTAAALPERMAAALTCRPAGVVLDLSALCFLDCAGARALLAAGRRVAAPGAALVLAAPGLSVARLLEVTGLGCDVEVCDIVDMALAVISRTERVPSVLARNPGPQPAGLAPVEVVQLNR